jgi:hypothetical protein
MFGLGRKDRKPTILTDHQKVTLAGALAEMLAMQMVFAKVSRPEVTKVEVIKGEINKKALGYIYGFVDCALQSRRQDTTDPAVGIPVTYYVLSEIFPGHEQRYLDYLAEHLSDQIVVAGMMYGGRQYSQFVAKPGSKGVAMGLARVILDEQDGRS